MLERYGDRRRRRYTSTQIVRPKNQRDDLARRCERLSRLTCRSGRQLQLISTTIVHSSSTPENPALAGERLSIVEVDTVQTVGSTAKGRLPKEIMGPASGSLHNQREWFTIERANSHEGRREGWLSAKTAEQQGCEQGSSNGRDISLELASVSGNRPWSQIWDGKSNVLKL
jgi:hypothetical protein